ncbi:MAG TPA: S41 family peptidase [bacterium]|nr:S41 family peptidase [bacterium]
MTVKNCNVIIRVFFLGFLLSAAVPVILAADAIGGSGLAVSPDGNTLAFSLQGDIWTVPSAGGTARRLTVHPGEDLAPAFSPDGRSIAFSSNRNGDHDIYLMDASGGEPIRLTYDSADDIVSQFAPSGRWIIFNSYRDFREYVTWRVPVNGGQPSRLCPLESSHGKLSPDESYFVYQKGFTGSYRQGYRGPSATNIWLYTFDTRNTVRLTHTRWSDRNPVWAGGNEALYFISEQSGPQNIYRFQIDTGEITPITAFTEGLISEIACPVSGDPVFFRKDARIWRIADGESARQIPIDVPADRRRSELETIDFSGCGELSVSPEGDQLVIEHRGDLFALPPDGGDTTVLTETPFREKSPRWHPSENQIFYIGDRTGNGEIYRLSPDDGDRKLFHKARFFKETRILESDVPLEYMEITPDGKQIIYLTIDGRLICCGIDGSNSRLLLENAYAYNVTVSPDSRWIAFLQSYSGLHYDTWLMHLESGRSERISKLHGFDSDVRFSPDGKQLLMVSGYQGDNEIYAVWLSVKDHEKYRDESDEAPPDGDASAGGTGNEKKDDTNGDNREPDTGTDPEPLRVDLDGIHERVRTLISWPSNDGLPLLVSGGKILLFKSDAMGTQAVFKGDYDDKDVSNIARLAEVNPDQLLPGKKPTVFYRNGESIGTLDVESGKNQPIRINGKMKVNRSAEFLQMYREAWNTIKYQFYDPDLHGADWDGAYRRYLPLVETARTAREFRDAVQRLIGELNASHLDIFGGDDLEISGPATGQTGLRLGQYRKDLGFEVVDVVPETPAYRVESRIQPGEYVRAVNRQMLSPDTPVAKYLNDTIGKAVDIEVVDPDTPEASRTVTLKPISPWQYHQKAYEYWVRQNRDMVDRLSENRIGYLHIQSMGHRSLESFRREMFGIQYEKEAMIIDVRGNPGGYIHNELIQHLTGERFGWSKARLEDPRDQPDYVWRKPSVVLIDERSFSDAEVFPNGYQELGIGKVIGMPTFGGVIGTGGFHMLNGAWFRLPWVGWYTRDGRNMENTGAIPDIMVERAPTEQSEGRDSQIERAVTELLSELP